MTVSYLEDFYGGRRQCRWSHPLTRKLRSIRGRFAVRPVKISKAAAA
jgi:hypothetical protein